MFPPSSPLMERVRVQTELEQLEREAIWNAHFQQARRWRLPKLSFFRRPKVEKRSTTTSELVKVEG
jgi:hypothetical protein